MKKAFFTFVLFLFSQGVCAEVDGFDVQKLPIGSEVTIPNPAITLVPLSTRVTLSSTDMPQTLKLSSIHLQSGKAVAVRVAIYDKQSPKVKYLTLKPGNNYLYSFKSLGSINVVPEAVANSSAIGQYSLRLESDKPLSISR